MTYSTEYHEADGCEVAVVEIEACELTSGDEFPAHDGERHYVEGVCEAAGTTTANVRTSDGRTYSTEFPSDYVVRVLA